MAYNTHRAALAVALTVAACGDDGIGTTQQGSSSGTGSTTEVGTTTNPTTTTTPTTDPTTGDPPTSTTVDPVTSSSSGDPTTVDPTTGTSTTDATTSTGTTAEDTTVGDSTSTGVVTECGDAIVQPGEECDDGADNGDMNACTSACLLAVCGDGLVGPGEGCDDANQEDADECTNACALATCGDGIVSVSEACGDGNADDSDLCTTSCTEAACGDGFVQPVAGEACDDGLDNDDNGDCTTTCNAAVCGDGLLHDQGMAGEACDNGPENGPGAPCNALCQLNVCGDGDKGPLEGCDDGNLTPGDGCDAACVLEVCGDMKVDVGEACDDGKDGDPDDGCTDLCELPVCGDGLLQPSLGETCDQAGQNSNTGACTLACKNAACGDGLIWAGMEQCDDGPGNADANACKLDCNKNICGDGKLLVGVEQCDDGNAVDNDACSNVCKAAVCNDGVKNGQETDVDCGGPACAICPSVILLAGANGGPNDSLGASFTVAGGWSTTPLASITVEGVALTMTSANLGVGLLRFTKIGDPKDNQLQYTTWDKGVWTPVAQLGNNTTKGWPSIAAATTTAQAVFHGQDNNLYYAAYVNGAWTPAAEAIGSQSTTFAPDIAALGANAAIIYNNSANANRISIRERNGGVWGNILQLSANFAANYPPDLLTLTSGPELAGFWPFTGNVVRFSPRTAGVWSVAISIPGITTAARPSVAALTGGGIALAARDLNNKFVATVWNGNAWQALPPLPGNPTISGSPSIAPGVGAALGEAAFIINGQVFHSRFTLFNLSWSAPVLVGGTNIQSVSLARSND